MMVEIDSNPWSCHFCKKEFTTIEVVDPPLRRCNYPEIGALGKDYCSDCFIYESGFIDYEATVQIISKNATPGCGRAFTKFWSYLPVYVLHHETRSVYKKWVGFRGAFAERLNKLLFLSRGGRRGLDPYPEKECKYTGYAKVKWHEMKDAFPYDTFGDDPCTYHHFINRQVEAFFESEDESGEETENEEETDDECA